MSRTQQVKHCRPLYVKKYKANGTSEEPWGKIHAYGTAKLSQVHQDSKTRAMSKNLG
jgi:hypothetical protein